MKARHDKSAEQSTGKLNIVYPDKLIQAIFKYFHEFARRDPNFYQDLVNSRLHGDRLFHGVTTSQVKIVYLLKKPEVVAEGSLYVWLGNNVLNYTLRNLAGEIAEGSFLLSELTPPYDLCLLDAPITAETAQLERGTLYYFPTADGIYYITSEMKTPVFLKKEDFACSDPLKGPEVQARKRELIRAIARNDDAHFLEEHFKHSAKLNELLHIEIIPHTTKTGHTNHGVILAEKDIHNALNDPDMSPVFAAFSLALDNMKYEISSRNIMKIHEMVMTFFAPIQNSSEWKTYWTEVCQILKDPVEQHIFKQSIANSIIFILDAKVKNPNMLKIQFMNSKLLVSILSYFVKELSPKEAYKQYRNMVINRAIKCNYDSLISYTEKGDERNIILTITGVKDNIKEGRSIAEYLIESYGVVKDPHNHLSHEYFALKERGKQTLYHTLNEQLVKLNNCDGSKFPDLKKKCLDLFAKALFEFVYDQHKNKKNPGRIKLKKLDQRTFVIIHQLVQTAHQCLNPAEPKIKKYETLHSDCNKQMKKLEKDAEKAKKAYKKDAVSPKPSEGMTSTDSEDLKLKGRKTYTRTTSVKQFAFADDGNSNPPEGKNSARDRDSDEARPEASQRITPRSLTGKKAFVSPGRINPLAHRKKDDIGDMTASAPREVIAARRRSLNPSDFSKINSTKKSPTENASGEHPKSVQSTGDDNEKRKQQFQASLGFFQAKETSAQEGTPAPTHEAKFSDEEREGMKKSRSLNNFNVLQQPQQPSPPPPPSQKQQHALAGLQQSFRVKLESISNPLQIPKGSSSSLPTSASSSRPQGAMLTSASSNRSLGTPTSASSNRSLGTPSSASSSRSTSSSSSSSPGPRVPRDKASTTLFRGLISKKGSAEVNPQEREERSPQAQPVQLERESSQRKIVTGIPAAAATIPQPPPVSSVTPPEQKQKPSIRDRFRLTKSATHRTNVADATNMNCEHIKSAPNP